MSRAAIVWTKERTEAFLAWLGSPDGQSFECCGHCKSCDEKLWRFHAEFEAKLDQADKEAK